MKKMIFCVLSMALILSLSTSASAIDTLGKIAEQGEFVVGVRDGAIPFGFFNQQNEHVGFSIDIAKEFHKALEAQLGKSLKLSLKTINPKTRIPLVANGTLNIVCGSTTHTVPREETVDFSITVFLTGSQLLVKKDSGINNPQDLADKKVGAAQGSTNEKAIRDLNTNGTIKPPARIVVFQEHSQGMLALENGIIDSYCGDGIHLAGLKAKAPNPDDYIIVSDLITYDPYAFILPENDSNFRDFINGELIRMFVDGRYEKYYQKWFGPQGTIPFEMTNEFKTLIKLQSWPL